MRTRDRWERWLRTNLGSLPLPTGVDKSSVWAAATMLASYANADGTGVTVSTNTLRNDLGIGQTKLVRILRWMEEQGLLTVVKKHGHRCGTQRVLTIPGRPPKRDVDHV